MSNEELQLDRATEGEVALVKSSTPTKSLAVYITTAYTKDKLGGVKLRGIGAGAINQMVKACISAKGRLKEKGVSLVSEFYYKDVTNAEGEVISAIEFEVKFVK